MKLNIDTDLISLLPEDTLQTGEEIKDEKIKK